MTKMVNGRKQTPETPETPFVRPGLSLQTYAMDRLARWAVWCLWRDNLLISNPSPKRTNSWWWAMIILPNMHQSGYIHRAHAPCPVDVIEAEETDVCVRALIALDERRGVKYGRVIVLCYLTRLNKHAKAAAMDPPGCVRTYFYRLSHAHDELLGLFNDAGAGLPLPESVRTAATA